MYTTSSALKSGAEAVEGCPFGIQFLEGLTRCAASRLSWWRMFRVLYPLTTALLLLGTQLHRTPSAYRRPGCRSASLQAPLRAGLGQ